MQFRQQLNPPGCQKWALNKHSWIINTLPRGSPGFFLIFSLFPWTCMKVHLNSCSYTSRFLCFLPIKPQLVLWGCKWTEGASTHFKTGIKVGLFLVSCKCRLAAVPTLLPWHSAEAWKAWQLLLHSLRRKVARAWFTDSSFKRQNLWEFMSGSGDARFTAQLRYRSY